jgi:UDP-N-acetylmuramoyl-L-alanyl-D-glutamate--2,6-diaminopimelate ligase
MEITGIAYHSKTVEPGNLFVAIEGFKTSGNRFIDEAIARGAVAIAIAAETAACATETVASTETVACATEAVAGVASAKGVASTPTYPGAIFQIKTDTPRRFLAEVSRRFYGYPDKNLTLVGITGTNGKTTTAYLIKSILEAAMRKTGLIGTIKHFDGKNWIKAENTTPESLDLTKLFTTMVKNKSSDCILEVSSHALTLDRVFGLDFKVAVFTNLTQDHLDFHKDLKEYGASKQLLFSNLKTASSAVLNRDDAFGATVKTPAQKLFYSLENKADITGRILDLGPDKIRLVVLFPEYELELISPLAGRHNAYNLVAAAGAAYALGVPPFAIQKGLRTMKSVPGRLERIARNVYIDYAHTPDALKNLLVTAREFTPGKVIVVFGCGGDRDKEKRPLMGKWATELAGFTIITSDNPRTEDPLEIIEAIRVGTTKSNYEIIADRYEAIQRALALAGPDDVVLIAGKGHEDYQIIGTEKRPFSDQAVVQKILGTERANENGARPGCAATKCSA